MKNLAKTPLIYKDEEDLKKMEIDLDEEDIDNEVESDDDLDVWWDMAKYPTDYE